MIVQKLIARHYSSSRPVNATIISIKFALQTRQKYRQNSPCKHDAINSQIIFNAMLSRNDERIAITQTANSLPFFASKFTFANFKGYKTP